MFVVSSSGRMVSRVNREMVDFDEGKIDACIDLVKRRFDTWDRKKKLN